MADLKIGIANWKIPSATPAAHSASADFPFLPYLEAEN
jgi:hypothetical protein